MNMPEILMVYPLNINKRKLECKLSQIPTDIDWS